MPKILLPSKFTELKALDRVSSVVHEMNCIFREISKDDFGIDGEIELVVPKASGGFETTGGIIKVQVKSGESYVVYDTTESFKTPVKKNDLLYWNAVTFPVIFVAYHPKDDKLYWKEVKSYVKNTRNVLQPPHHVTFVKAEDEFTRECFERVCQLARVSPPRVNFDQKERLFSNLLLVKRLPKYIYCAPTDQTDTRKVKEKLREGRQQVAPFLIKDGSLFALADLRAPQSVLRPYCDADNTDEIRTQFWVEDNHRDFVFLLNQLLGIHLRACGLWYSPEYKRNYFPKPLRGKERKMTWYNVRTKRQAPARTVAKYHQYGKDRFWRHLAVNLQFKNLGSAWFLQIDPKSFYTCDGETPYDPDKVGALTTTIRAKEHNPQVLNHVLFWSDVLSQRQPQIELNLFGKAIMVIEKEPISGVASFAIPNDSDEYDEGDAPQLDFGSILLVQSRERRYAWDTDGADEDEEDSSAEFGPFGKTIPGLHRSEIKIGFVGTRETISEALEWVTVCGCYIQSENVKTINQSSNRIGESLFDDEEDETEKHLRLEKILNRDFIGFNTDTQFACRFVTNPRWERSIEPRVLDTLLSIQDKQERIRQLVDAFDAEIESLATTSPSPDVILLALPDKITEEAARVRVSGNFWLDFRRAVKARAMRWGRPIQIIRSATLRGKGPLQEKATRAWNFCTAQYYKAEGVPGVRVVWNLTFALLASISTWPRKMTQN